MNLEELLKQSKEQRKSLIESINTVKSKEELDKVELELRKSDLQIKDLENKILEKRKSEDDSNLEWRSSKKASQEPKGALNPLATFGEENKQLRNNENKEIEYRKAFMNYVTQGISIPKDLRTAEVTQTTDVGAVIPTTILNKIIEELSATGMILPLVNRMSIKGGVAIPVGTIKPDCGEWVGESKGTESKKSSISKDAMITFSYHKLRCAVAVSLEVDTMSLAIFETTLINNIIKAMTKSLEQAIISGDGVGKPKGILTETTKKGQTLAVKTIGYDTLCNAEAALPLEYENGAVWCMTKKTFMQFAGMVDSNGQPIARTNYGITGKPERMLLGRNVVLCNYLDSYSDTLAKDKPFAFLFNFEDYTLNTNYQMSIKKYEDNDTDDQVTKAIMIVDGKVINKNSLVIIKKAE